MIVFKKLTVLLALILLFCVIGACYGVVHDFITYNISNEYYTKFKFIQFGLIESGNYPSTIKIEQLIVLTGLIATWWTGAVAGVLFGVFAWSGSPTAKMIRVMCRACIVMITTALIFGLLGYLVGNVSNLIGLSNFTASCPYCDPILDRDKFNIVGYIHSFSYIGGTIGIILGCIAITKQKKNNVY